MAKYSNYPTSASILSSDVILFHKDSNNVETVIAFSDLQTSVLATLPISALSAASGATSLDNFIIDDGGVNKRITFSNLYASIPAATTGVAGLMAAADKTNLVNATATLAAATTSATGGTLVLRAAGGDITGRDVIANRDLYAGTDLHLQNTGLVSWVSGASLSTTDVSTLQAATSANNIFAIVRRDGSGYVELGGLQLGGSTSTDRLTKWHWHPTSTSLAGGAPTEQFDINITGSGFAAKPNFGIFIPVNNNYTGTYLVTSGSSTATNARCEFRKIDGTNIPAGTFLGMAILATLG